MTAKQEVFLEAVKKLPYLNTGSFCRCFLEKVLFEVIGKTGLSHTELRSASDGAIKAWEIELSGEVEGLETYERKGD